MKDLLCAGMTGVTRDAVLQTACRGGEFDALGIRELFLQRINQTGHKAVAAAYTVDDMHRIAAAEKAFTVGVKHG